jgi:hypothetical protein
MSISEFAEPVPIGIASVIVFVAGSIRSSDASSWLSVHTASDVATRPTGKWKPAIVATGASVGSGAAARALEEAAGVADGWVGADAAAEAGAEAGAEADAEAGAPDEMTDAPPAPPHAATTTASADRAVAMDTGRGTRMGHSPLLA